MVWGKLPPALPAEDRAMGCECGSGPRSLKTEEVQLSTSVLDQLESGSRFVVLAGTVFGGCRVVGEGGTAEEALQNMHQVLKTTVQDGLAVLLGCVPKRVLVVQVDSAYDVSVCTSQKVQIGLTPRPRPA